MLEYVKPEGLYVNGSGSSIDGVVLMKKMFRLLSLATILGCSFVASSHAELKDDASLLLDLEKTSNSRSRYKDGAAVVTWGYAGYFSGLGAVITYSLRDLYLHGAKCVDIDSGMAGIVKLLFEVSKGLGLVYGAVFVGVLSFGGLRLFINKIKSWYREGSVYRNTLAQILKQWSTMLQDKEKYNFLEPVYQAYVANGNKVTLSEKEAQAVFEKIVKDDVVVAVGA